ncbi:MAG: acyl-CoA dehydrogenase family protein [Burkholderiales bacterium]
MNDELSAPFEQLLEDRCTPALVRTIEGGGSSAALWSDIEASGFLDALVPEAHGGAGLSLTDIHPLVEACGRTALPLPVAETMMARALMAGSPMPAGPVALATGARDAAGAIACPTTAFATTAAFVLVSVDGELRVLPANTAEQSASASGALAATLQWSAAAARGSQGVGASSIDLRAVQACLLAARMAGTMTRLFRMTLGHANDRVQFGKPIGRFQAIQHQISVMAEHSALARSAGRLGCASSTPLPSPRAAAIAKAVTSESAPPVAAIAHAVHGAIGITAEFDLQLFTRQLHEARLCAGTESYWYARVGTERLAADAATTLDFIRGADAPASR